MADDSLDGHELVAHPCRGGAALGVARGQRTLDGQHLTHAWGEVLRDPQQVVVAEVPELDPVGLAITHTRSGALVGDPERHPLADQPLGDVGGE